MKLLKQVHMWWSMNINTFNCSKQQSSNYDYSICTYPLFHPDLDDPVITVHQSVGETKEQFYFERTVFLRCVSNSNPPVHYTWRRGRHALSQGSDSGVEIYEPFFTQASSTSCLLTTTLTHASITFKPLLPPTTNQTPFLLRKVVSLTSRWQQ